MNLRRAGLACIASTALVLVGLAAPQAHAADKDVVQTSGAADGRYIVVMKSGAAAASVSAKKVAKTNKVLATYTSTINGFAVSASKAEAKRMANDPSVQAVYEDGRVKKTGDEPSKNVNQSIPAPPNSYWGLNRVDQRVLPSNTAGVYTWVYSGAGVHAYIMDTGIQTTHSQFGGRATFDFTATDAGNPGVDCDGHGTHVAGTVGGSTYGVAKNVKLHAVKVLDCFGSGWWSDVLEGIDWITANAVKPAVVNASLGGGLFTPVNDAITASIASGITWSVAAGNDSANACTYSPASTPNAITVGATGDYDRPSTPISDKRAWFSNYGTCLDIFAPGAHIRSSYIGSNTAVTTMSGTSMASPHAAGVAALILQKSPTMSPASVRNYMVSMSTKNKITSPGTGSPNRLLYAGNVPTLTVNASPEPITCTRSITVAGKLTLQGVALSGRTVEVWYNRSGPTAPVFKGTATTNSLGNYARSVSQSYDGYWYVVYRGAALIGSKQSTSDFVNCSNR